MRQARRSERLPKIFAHAREPGFRTRTMTQEGSAHGCTSRTPLPSRLSRSSSTELRQRLQIQRCGCRDRLPEEKADSRQLKVKREEGVGLNIRAPSSPRHSEKSALTAH